MHKNLLLNKIETHGSHPEEPVKTFDFLTMFKHLKKKTYPTFIQTHEPDLIAPYRSTSSRPKSVNFFRAKTEVGQKAMSKTLSGEVAWRQSKTNRMKRCSTEKIEKKCWSLPPTPNQKKRSYRYLPINNSCLKKIPLRENLHTEQNESNKFELPDEILFKNPEKGYKKKGLVTVRRKHRPGPAFQSKDLEVRIQGLKIV